MRRRVVTAIGRAGCWPDVVKTTRALLQHGHGHAETLLAGLVDWMHAMGFSTLDEVRGLMSVAREADPEVHRRARVYGCARGRPADYGG